MKKQKLELPLNLTHDQFINGTEESPQLVKQGKPHAVTFTLTARDIGVLEQQIDRAIGLGRRNKSKSATIRMALKALSDSSDEYFLELHNKF